jgi:hypothetical protein
MLAGEPSIPAKSNEGDIELRGRVVCLAEEMAKLHGANVLQDHLHQWGFKTADGKYYTLVRTRNTEAFFSDEEMRQRELLIRGRVFPDTLLLDAIPLRSVKNGKIHDIYYWCDICSIRSVAPGECMCCQAPVKLVENPLSE